jgi:TonB family protein
MAIPARFACKGSHPGHFLDVDGRRVVVTLNVRRMSDVDEILVPFLGKGAVLAPQPTYPVRPPWTDKEGKSIYGMHVRKDGKVEDVRILKTSGDLTFDGITISTLRKWRLRKGPLIVELPLAFRLTPRTFDFRVVKR